MERHEVVSILESLAAGADPHLAAQLPPEALGAPDVVEALAVAAETLKNFPPQNGKRSRGERPAAAGLPWREEEDSALCREHEAGLPIPELAQRHGRSLGAITSRLVKLGRLPADSIPPRFRPAPAAPQ